MVLSHQESAHSSAEMASLALHLNIFIRKLYAGVLYFASTSKISSQLSNARCQTTRFFFQFAVKFRTSVAKHKKDFSSDSYQYAIEFALLLLEGRSAVNKEGHLSL